MAGAALGVPINILCGLYSGLVVARWARFESLRSDVKRFILSVDFVQEVKTVKYELRERKLAELVSTTSDLLFLQHRSAAEKALQIQREIVNALGPPSGVEITFEQAKNQYSLWQELCREMSPNWRVILNLKPQL